MPIDAHDIDHVCAKQQRRPTIALLADFITDAVGAYEAHFRNVIASQCEALDVNLLLVYGGAFGHPHPSSRAQHTVFDLVGSDTVDGVVVLSTTLSSYSGPKRIRELFSRFKGLACCSVGVAIESVPSIVIDNRASMRAVIEHLIRVHGRKRIAFIGGTPDNPEAQARYEAYREVLTEHGQAVDPALFAYGQFFGRGACAAVQQILDRNVSFDALVCANDSMAQAVTRLLSAKGFRIPRDLSVTGFDDVLGSKLMKPPLTTAAQPFEALAAKALELVLDQLAHREVPQLVELKAGLVLRQSCGCGRDSVTFNAQENVTYATEALAHLRETGARVRQLLATELAVVPGYEIDGPELLVAGLEGELRGSAGAFIDVVEAISDAAAQHPDHLAGVQRSIVCLRRALRKFSCLGLEDLWHAARDCIELAALRGHINYRVQLDDKYLRLLQSSEDVSRALNRDSFRTCLANTLPLMNIRTGTIAKYTDDTREQLEVLVDLVEEQLKEDSAERFSARELMGATRQRARNRSTSLLLPLVLEDKPLGVAIFDYSSDTVGQLMVRAQISAALSSILLHQEMVERSMQHERSVQERIATTKRMEALSLLAGGVAHDLNNALGPLVALPDVILDDLNAALAGESAAELRKDVESVKSAALRATQTIKDLLTLGRQGRTAKEPVNLNKVIGSGFSSDLLLMVKDTASSVKLRLDLSKESLVVLASEAHLIRAVTNLIHNAVEAIAVSGEVVIKVSAAKLDSPMYGFETIDAGSYAVVTVSDNGRGMSEADLHQVFEPFFTKKRTSDRTGSGLGLAIVHGVVKEHEGFIDVTSKPGEGTTFSLYLPRLEASLRESVRSLSPVPRGRGKILIVDDEPVQLRTGRRVLSRLGYDVDTQQSGQEAYEYLVRAAETGVSPYDLVILDMILNEDLDGLERFEQIRALFPTQRAIVVSGHAPTERAEAAFRRGLAWLSKPYTAEGLAKAVRAALAERPGSQANQKQNSPI